MSSSVFKIQEHTIETSHIREYPRALAGDQEDVCQLAIKQYTPKLRRPSVKNEITIVGAHANGFPKELYEPLWDELYDRLNNIGIHIGNIFIADVAHQGRSGVLNEEKLGNDPSWLDHPRDLFLMVNHFRKEMKRPLVGIGHSMGGNNLVNLSLMHPRLFTTLILMDPVFSRAPSPQGNFGPAKASTFRRETWPSRKAAKAKLQSSKFYQTWDPRVLDKWIEYGLRDLPTYLIPDEIPASSSTSSDDAPVTLTTTKHQEVRTFLRPQFPTQDYPNPNEDPDSINHPDADPSAGPTSPFYSPVPISTFFRLPYVRPSVFYIFGDPAAGAFLSEPVLKADKLATTGIGVGGSGGVKKGRVSSVTFDGIGHLIPMEVVGETADAAAGWIGPEIERWRAIEDAERREWLAIPKKERAMLDNDYIRVMKGDWIEGGGKSEKRGSKL